MLFECWSGKGSEEGGWNRSSQRVGKTETRDAGTGRRRLCLVIASLAVLMVKRKWSARFGIFAAVFQCIQRWAGHVARMGEEKGVYRVLVGKREGRRPLGET